MPDLPSSLPADAVQAAAHKIPPAPEGWPTASVDAIHNAHNDGGLRARLAATLWTRDYQPGPEASISGYVYDLADRVAEVVEEARREERARIAEHVREIAADGDWGHVNLRAFIARHARLKTGDSAVAVLLAVADEIEGADQ